MQNSAFYAQRAHMRRRCIAILFLGLFSVVFSRETRSEEHKRPDVLLIVMDTTRADHFGCYGYERATTPYIDRVAEDAVIFTDALSVIPLTTPSHVSLMTGLHPDRHHVYRNAYPFGNNFTMMAELFNKAGYKTAAAVSTILLGPRLGFRRGFDFFSGVNRKRRNAMRRGEETVQEALDWLSGSYKEEFFLWIHLYDPHLPYIPPQEFGLRFNPEYEHYYKVTREQMGMPDDYPEYTDQRHNKKINAEESKVRPRPRRHPMRFPRKIPPYQVAALRDAYDGEIAYDDFSLRRIFDFLKEKGIYNNTIIVIIGDHGEVLYEKADYFGHHNFLFQGSLKIPCIMKFPGIPPRKIHKRITTVDILPTLLDAVGIEHPQEIDGVSYWGMIKDNKSVTAPEHTVVLTHPSRRRKPKENGKSKSAVTSEEQKKQEASGSRSTALDFEDVFSKIAILQGRWKLILDLYPADQQQKQFYDLKRDPEEQYNLYDTGEADYIIAELEAFAGDYLFGKKDTKIERKSFRRRKDQKTVDALKSLGYLQ